MSPHYLYSTRNADVNGLNERQLAQCPGESFSFPCHDIYESCDNFLRARLCKDLNDRIPQEMSLKVGAQVILNISCLFNMNSRYY